MTSQRKRKNESVGESLVRESERGSSIIEVTLLAPWIFILFMGIINFGFYAYAMIAVENAARVAALHTSATSLPNDAQKQTFACNHVLSELSYLPNVKNLGAWDCTALPLDVSVDPVTAPDSADQIAPASRVTVSYRSAQLFRIPGITDRLTVNRIVEMRSIVSN
jgi:Flp pilus assembly protein TadG